MAAPVAASGLVDASGMATGIIPGTLARDSAAGTASSASTGDFSSCCSARAAPANSWRCSPDRGRRDRGSGDADDGDRGASTLVGDAAAAAASAVTVARAGRQDSSPNLAGQPDEGCGTRHVRLPRSARTGVPGSQNPTFEILNTPLELLRLKCEEAGLKEMVQVVSRRKTVTTFKGMGPMTAYK